MTIGTNAATTTYTALGTAGSEIKQLYVRNTDGSLGTKYVQMTGTPTTGKFVYNPGTKALTFFAGDLAAGSKIVAFYNATAGATTQTITSTTDRFAKNVKMVATGLARDICTGVDYKCQLIFYKAKISNGFEFALSADGDPSVQSLEFEALKACGSTDLWDLIVFESVT